MKKIAFFQKNTSGFFNPASFNLPKVAKNRKAVRVILRRVAKLACVLICAISFITQSAAAEGQQVYQLEIDPQPLGDALVQLSDQTQTLVLFPYHLVASQISPGVKGTFTLTDAMNEVLKGTDLVGSLTKKQVMMIAHNQNGQHQTGKNNMNTKRNTLKTKHTALAAIVAFLFSNGTVAQEASVADASAETTENATTEQLENKPVIERIEVTATKRSAWAQDLPMSITAIGNQEIEKRGLVQMDDYMSTLPGVTMQDLGTVGNSIVIRGTAVQPQEEKEAVSVYFGETPVSGLGAVDAGSTDFKMVDIQRVEVLRGPQGTLFGAGSMGGTVRIIPTAPNLIETEGNVAAMYSQTGGYGSGNNSLQGVVNLPLIEDTLALRAVAYRFDDSGYIKSIADSYNGPFNLPPTANTKDTFGETAAAWGATVKDEGDRGAVVTDGARIAALWRPTDAFSANLSYVTQTSEQDGRGDIDTAYGDFVQLRVKPSPNSPLLDGPDLVAGPPLGAEGTYSKVNITNLTLDYDLDWGNFHSSTSWLEQDSWSRMDHVRNLPVMGMLFSTYSVEAENFSQEIRFASNFDGPLQALLGFYYEDNDKQRDYAEGFLGDPSELSNFFDSLEANWNSVFAAPSNAPVDFAWTEAYWSISPNVTSLQQTAWFGELNWEITEQISVLLGMRDYEYKQSNLSYSQGFWDESIVPIVNSDVAGKNSGQTYKASLSWTPNSKTLIYAQWTEGFRPGDALARLNPAQYDPEGTGFYTAADGLKVPIRNQTDPDTLESYEIGLKASFFNNRVNLDTALYYINWEGLPVGLRVMRLDIENASSAYTINAGKSTSKGLELSSNILLSDNIRLYVSTSYNNSELSEDGILGLKGDDLPGSADFNFSAGLEYNFEWFGYPAFARVDYSYLDEFLTYLPSEPESLTAPESGGYGLVHFKSGIQMGNFNTSLFVKNLTNEDDFSWLSTEFSTVGPRGHRLRPRTIGLNVSYQF